MQRIAINETYDLLRTLYLKNPAAGRVHHLLPRAGEGGPQGRMRAKTRCISLPSGRSKPGLNGRSQRAAPTRRHAVQNIRNCTYANFRKDVFYFSCCFFWRAGGGGRGRRGGPRSRPQADAGAGTEHTRSVTFLSLEPPRGRRALVARGAPRGPFNIAPVLCEARGLRRRLCARAFCIMPRYVEGTAPTSPP